MAQKRMISKDIYHSYKFLTLSPSARDLYTYLVLATDNDGIVEAYSVLKMIGGNANDLDTLVRLHFIYPLNEEMLIYVTDFQLYNKLDKRGNASVHRDLLLSQKPELKDLLIDYTGRKKKEEAPKNQTIIVTQEQGYIPLKT